MQKSLETSGQIIYPDRVEIVRISVDREACLMCSLRGIVNRRPMRPNSPTRPSYVSYTTFPPSQSLNGTDTSAVALINDANLL